ncbi:ABC transporter substrate-binding protein [Phycicoccus sp. M110.8]|uniref:ABC transporter substrate-binding protein n=1 Tax=Phycicoccus sp. M110.8 TaxID=3075433 RepID=UPI0028FD1CEE|nr:ABC transporter substrate-binding protein [Phycicoccus sp. M110.8]MDU0313149.1 ABC transporter substrate-binding protein [Phycicoccus sp. M110.8]
MNTQSPSGDVTWASTGFSRRSFLQVTGGLSLGAVLSASIAACSGPASSGSIGKGAKGSHVDVAIGYNNNSSWDPHNTGSAFAMAAHQHVYEPLWDAAPRTREPFAALASELPKDTQATEWTVTLRDGATWHDGKPVTADDVIYSVNRILSKDAKVLTNAFFASWLTGATKVDDRTVKLTLAFPFAAALQRFSILKIVPKHHFESKPDDFFKSGANALGSGPYKVAGHQDTSFTKFARHDKYNGSLKPSFETMQWNVSVDAAARIALLTSGGVQISDNIPQANIDAIKGRGLTVQGVDSMNLLGLAFNTSKKPFGDKRVRQALRMAIDTKKLIDVAIAGKGTPATGFLHEASPEFHRAATQYTYDPEKAKALLKEAGVTNLKLRLLSTNISWTAIAVNTIKESWEAIGVATTLDVRETAAFNTAVAAGEPADVLTFSGNPNQFGADADLNIRWFYSPSTPFLPWNKWGQTPEYKKLDAQLAAAQREPDQAKHKALLDQAMDTIADEGVIYPVMHMQLFTSWDPKKLTSVTPLDIPGVNLLKTTSAV